MSKCPICQAECETHQSYIDHILLEEYYRCPSGHYYYEFITGTTVTHVGDKEFYTHYTHTEEHFKQYCMDVDAAIKELKAELYSTGSVTD
jgi:hypothetical protein